jgi:thiosulfate dehydrogenase
LAKTVAPAIKADNWGEPMRRLALLAVLLCGVANAQQPDELARYGLELIDHTSARIGPDAPDSDKRFSGNRLECSSCHINGGTEPFALPYDGIAPLYPRFSARTDAMQDLADRVNDCMQRSMNGRALPRDSLEMRALLAYLNSLGSKSPAERGAPVLPLPTRAVDPRHGATVYARVCSACHQSNGHGVELQLGDRVEQQRHYLYPPLWGADSFNDAAGMARIVTGAWFVHANMPKGVTYQNPLLSPDDAYDVMAFIATKPRPHKAGLAKDYPNIWLKPVGTLFPPWPGNFTAKQNRFGPWVPILAWRRDNAPPSNEPPAANDLEQSARR